MDGYVPVMTGDQRTKFLLDESELPTQWYNVIPDLPSPPPPPLHPGTHAAGRARRSRAAVPDGADRAGGHRRQLRRHPRRRARRLPAVAAERRCTAPTAWRRLLDTPAKIYYKYEGVSPAGSHKPNTSVPQAYYNHEEGITQADHGDRRRPVGHRPRLRLRPVRHRVRDLAGRRVVPLEAVPPHDDGGLRGDAALQPVRGHRVRPLPARRRPRPQRQPRHRHLRGGGDGRRRSRRPATPSAACSTTS